MELDPSDALNHAGNTGSSGVAVLLSTKVDPPNCRFEVNNGLSERDGPNRPYGSTPTMIGPPCLQG
jgi:hypothetical protein